MEPSCSFYITGFSQFAGVDDNPTEHLITMLRDRLASGGSARASYRVLGTAVLEVAAEPCRLFVKELFRSGLQPTGTDGSSAAAAAPATAGSNGGGQAAGAGASASDPEGPTVVLHLGVDVKASTFKLERQAANEATFRVPDQRGGRPQGQRIDDHPGVPLGARLRSSLDCAALTSHLALRGFPVQTSDDAGRYLCNLTYYLSLCESEKARVRRGAPLHALFLHVPPADVVRLSRQLDFLLCLLEAIAQQLAAAPAGHMPPAAHAPAPEAIAAEAAEAADAAEAAAVAALAAQLAASGSKQAAASAALPS